MKSDIFKWLASPSYEEDAATTMGEWSQAREFEAGTLVFREEEAADGCFVVEEGELEIIKSLGLADERVVGVIEAGGIVGEMGLLNPESRRTASVRARTAVRLIALTRAEFDNLLHRRPELACEVLRTLSSRFEASQNATILELRETNRQLTEAYERLQQAQRELVEKERMESELEVARSIQKSMLPRTLPTLDGFDFGAIMEPARAVGGDFFDFIPLGDGKLGIAVGDVSDKGVPAALFMALSLSLLRAEAHRAGSVAEAVVNVNRHLLGLNDTGMFVTLLYGVLDGSTREFRYVRAGHELPLIRTESGGELPLSRTPGVPLGALDEILLDEQTVRLPSPCTVLIYTDGVTDVVDAGDRQLGIEGLRAAFLPDSGESAQALCDRLLAVCASHRGETPQYDDITMVVVRVG